MSELNRYEPPNAEVADIAQPDRGSNVDKLQVSEVWKLRFRAIQKAGGVKLPKLRELTAGERRKISFNILAFLFGPLYYLSKGMWKKAISLSVICLAAIFVLSLVLDLLGLDRFANALGYGAAAFFAIRANIDYYKKKVLGDNGWW